MRRQLLVAVLVLGALVGASAAGVWITNRIGTPASAIPPPAPPPNWTEIATAIATLIALLGVYLAWRSALTQIGEARTSRHASLMADLSRRWDEELLTRSREQAATYGKEGPELRARMAELDEEQSEELFILQRIPNYFEDLGVLQAVGAISLDMIVESLGRTAVDTWAKWDDSVAFLREKYADPRIYEHFERLAGEIRGVLEQPPKGAVEA